MDSTVGRNEELGFKKCAFTFLKMDRAVEKKLVKILTGQLAGVNFDEAFEDFID
jgi:c-di-GMP-binding flagellar brake protein YcgR